MKKFSIVDALQKFPGGMMIVPLLLGSLVRTFAPGFLDLGSFTTALFKNGALPLIALLIVATGAQINLRQGKGVMALSGALLVAKVFLPGLMVILYGFAFGREGILGISLLAALIAFTNSNGGLWLALAGQYGDDEDRGAYIVSALNDGPFFTLLFLGLSGLGAIPWVFILAAIVPFLLGFVLGNLDQKFADMMKPTASITIPFFAFSLGAGIDLLNLAKGGFTGIVLGLLVAGVTGGLGFLVYQTFFKKNSGIGFAIGTTAGNAVATVAVVVQADPSFAPFSGSATAQVAASVLVTAFVTPFVTHFLCKRFSERLGAAAQGAAGKRVR
ncbi:MAG TPA: 2-keto-3-deoxygluconate permease [Magnetospirillaceae bacterium]|nr:2-keto-3-deoxygluconate permease [Magnetospirillaceae bacterium]